MAMNDFIRFVRTPTGVEIQIPPGTPQLVIREGALELPLDPADEGAVRAYSLFGKTSTGQIMYKDATGVKALP